MGYIYDKDLEFLSNCNNEELQGLFELLAFNPKDGNKRLTSSLLSSNEYKEFKNDYKKYWKKIAAELQLYGGNTIINLIRGGNGVTYRVILEDVAKRLKIPVLECIPTPEVENAICEKLMLDLFSKMPDQDIQKFLSELAEHDEELKEMLATYGNIPWGKIGASIVREFFKAGGIATYRVTLTVANLIWRELFGKGLTFVANKTIAKIVGGLLSGPIALALNAWLIADITGPAMRVTIPAVVLISTLRQKYNLSIDEDYFE